jgi:hypothetical protein
MGTGAVEGGTFPDGKAAGGVKLNTHLYLVLRLRMSKAVPPFSPPPPPRACIPCMGKLLPSADILKPAHRFEKQICSGPQVKGCSSV